MERGLIYGIERFAIHDGPGIRTLVFMKGCPLRCLWCSSPQTQSPFPQLMYDPDLCQQCCTCQLNCPNLALTCSLDSGVSIDQDLCTFCGECVNACPHEALKTAGRFITADELFREVSRDHSFFRRSQGGVTVGGGEPTLQYAFVAAFLQRCKSQNMHTVIETCGYCGWEQLNKILTYTDMVFMDIKHMDETVHQQITGVSNRMILENARKVAQKRPLVIRIPVVPSCNDSEENIRETAEFAAELGGNLLRIDLLPYHQLGQGSYKRLGMEYQLDGVEPPGQEQMERFRAIVENCGIKTQIEE